jgi:hypothetical protein
MPEGIIRDPKQNPRERNFGIVFCTASENPEDVGMYFKYVKIANDYSRLYMAGEAVRFRITNREPEVIDNINISGNCTIECYLPDAEQDRKAPVNKELIRPIPPPARANAINNAIQQGKMQSDFGDQLIPHPTPQAPICPPGFTK